MLEVNTLPKLLRRNYEKYGSDKTAMRFKDYGIWNEVSWEEYYQSVKYMCLGLMSIGLKRGDKVSIIGDNDPQWYWAELASQAAGAATTGLFVDVLPGELQYIVDHSDSSFIFAKDQEQVDKFLSVKKELPEVKKVIYWDPKGLKNYKEELILSLDQLIEKGKKYDQVKAGSFEKSIDKGRGEDLAIITYTSGTTGLPKGTMFNFGALLATTKSWQEVDPWLDTDEYLSYISPAWGAEQYLGITGGLLSGLSINFPEKPESIQSNIREISPQVLLYGARLWESIVSTAQAKITDSGSFKRNCYKVGMYIGNKVMEMNGREGKANLLWRVMYFFAKVLVYRQLKDKFGLKKIRYAYTAGAGLSPDAIRFFHTIGVNLKQLYGLSETGINACHRDNDVAFESVGTALPSSEIKISDNGEILIKSKAMFMGYYKNEKATADVLKDGWFHTGDAGYINADGQLVYLDRVSEMQELKGGEKFSPQFIEMRLRFSPYVQDVMVIGDKEHGYVIAIVSINFDNVGRWVEAQHINYTTLIDLSQKEEVIELIKGEIEKVNRFVPEKVRIRRFVVLHKEFDADESELTRTRKLKRASIRQRYSELIEGVYSDLNEVSINAAVTYRDGKTGVVKALVKITHAN